MKLRIFRFLSLLALGITACNTPPLPALPASHPVSKEAPPGTVHHYFSGLREDGATHTTKQLLSESEVTETESPPRKMPEMPMNHSDMKMPMDHSDMSMPMEHHKM
jgi:hypothetical protein